MGLGTLPGAWEVSWWPHPQKRLSFSPPQLCTENSFPVMGGTPGISEGNFSDQEQKKLMFMAINKTI